MPIVGFVHKTTYYIAIKTLDEVGNESVLSNIITFTTPPDPTLEEEEEDLGLEEEEEAEVAVGLDDDDEEGLEEEEEGLDDEEEGLEEEEEGLDEEDLAEAVLEEDEGLEALGEGALRKTRSSRLPRTASWNARTWVDCRRRSGSIGR